MTEYIIETKNLTKRFGKDIAVNSINMKIERGNVKKYMDYLAEMELEKLQLCACF